jgi:hypothetical protein
MDRALILEWLKDEEVRGLLREILGSPPLPKYMTIREFAVHHKVTPQTISVWIRRGLPGYLAGKVRRIPVDEADGWVEAGHAMKPPSGRVRTRRR